MCYSVVYFKLSAYDINLEKYEDRYILMFTYDFTSIQLLFDQHKYSHTLLLIFFYKAVIRDILFRYKSFLSSPIKLLPDCTRPTFDIGSLYNLAT